MLGMRYLVCERPYRLKCHKWNVTDETGCRNDPDFGCHSYADVYLQQSDDFRQPVCRLGAKKAAVRCPREKCETCALVPLSHWSECEPKRCSVKPATRSRKRSPVEPCSKQVALEKLEEIDKCNAVEGCEALKN